MSGSGLGYTVTRVCASPRNLTLVYQTVFPRERVESGNETTYVTTGLEELGNKAIGTTGAFKQ